MIKTDYGEVVKPPGEATQVARKADAHLSGRILVVDDDRFLCALLESILIKAGHQVQVCVSGEEAISKLNGGSFDLVITDLGMPGVGGLKVLKKAKELDPSCEVIVVTAHTSVGSAVEIMKLGAHDCIVKPFNVDQISVAVNEAIQRRRLLQVDSLTELYDSRAFYDFLRAEFGRSKRYLRPVSLLMMSLDSLGVDSNTFEHPTNSGILNEVACLVKKSVRDCDFVGRFGEDELAIILVETNKVDAVATANRLRCLVEETDFEWCDPSVYQDGTVTASIGVASYPLDACQQINLMTKAEEALHEAKGTGGNLVRTAKRELSLMGSYREKRLYFLCKRCMDIIVSLLFLVIGFPLIMLIAVLIKLDSPGPVVFKQRRAGLRKGLVGGKKQWNLSMFNMYKFRTMYHNLDDGFHRSFMRAFVSDQVDGGENGGIYKPIEDPQITRVGRILRKTSLDELPQMLNVLKGEMSVVGPRPNVPWEVGEYRPRHYKRFEVLPGITGLAQVRGRSRILFDRIVEYDIEYIEKQSLALDLKILLWTIPSLIFGKGAK